MPDNLFEQVAEMDENSLREYLILNHRVNPLIIPLEKMDKTKLVDFLAENYRRDLMDLHSECQ